MDGKANIMTTTATDLLLFLNLFQLSLLLLDPRQLSTHTHAHTHTNPEMNHHTTRTCRHDAMATASIMCQTSSHYGILRVRSSLDPSLPPLFCPFSARFPPSTSCFHQLNLSTPSLPCALTSSTSFSFLFGALLARARRCCFLSWRQHVR